MVTSRILFTAKQKDELWERWKNGQSVLAISRGLERRNKTGVQRIVALNGGIAPAPRCRAVAALKLEEREEISRGIAAGRSVRRIARGLKRSPSTISREIRRNGALLPQNSALTSAGGELRFGNGITLLAKFDGEFASYSSTYEGTGTFRYRW